MGEEDENTTKVARLLEVAQAPIENLDSSDVEESEWSHLVHFLRRPWFFRKWVLQEVCLAKCCSLRCGSFIWDWNVLLNTYQCVLDSESDATMPVFDILDRGVIDFCTNWSEKREVYSNNLLRILNRSRGTYATQKLDAIHAVLPQAEDNLGIRVDYRSSMIDVLIDAAERLLNRAGLALLRCSMDNDFNRPSELPSWVPDWTHMIRNTVLANADSHHSKRIYEAIQSERQVLRDEIHMIEGRTLRTEMLDVDEVDIVGQLWPDSDNSEAGTLGYQALSRLQEWYRMLQTSDIGQDSIYHPTGESIALAILLTITAGHPEAKYFNMAPYLVWDELFSKLSDFLRRSEAKQSERLSQNSGFDDQSLSNLYNTIMYYCSRRAFFTTTQGRMGLGPACMLPSDGIFMSHELYLPTVMRKSETGKWKLIGEC